MSATMAVDSFRASCGFSMPVLKPDGVLFLSIIHSSFLSNFGPAVCRALFSKFIAAKRGASSVRAPITLRVEQRAPSTGCTRKPQAIASVEGGDCRAVKILDAPTTREGGGRPDRRVISINAGRILIPLTRLLGDNRLLSECRSGKTPPLGSPVRLLSVAAPGILGMELLMGDVDAYSPPGGDQ